MLSLAMPVFFETLTLRLFPLTEFCPMSEYNVVPGQNTTLNK